MNKIKVREAAEAGVKLPEPVLSGSGDHSYEVIIARLDSIGVLGRSPEQALRNARRMLDGCTAVLAVREFKED